MSLKNDFTMEEAEQIGNMIGINWQMIDPDQFRKGLHVELEHGLIDPETNVSNDDPLITGKIAMAHLKEFADYYDRLEKMETEAHAFWDHQNQG